MSLILFDEPRVWQQLLPLTYTRPVAALRLGILTIAEKWAIDLQDEYSYQTEVYLQQKFRFKGGEGSL